MMVQKRIEFKSKRSGNSTIATIAVDGDYNQVLVRLWHKDFSAPKRSYQIIRNTNDIFNSLSDWCNFRDLKTRLNSISSDLIGEDEWFAARIKHIISLYTEDAKKYVERENQRILEMQRIRIAASQKELEMKEMLDNIEEKLLLTE